MAACSAQAAGRATACAGAGWPSWRCTRGGCLPSWSVPELAACSRCWLSWALVLCSLKHKTFSRGDLPAFAAEQEVRCRIRQPFGAAELPACRLPCLLPCGPHPGRFQRLFACNGVQMQGQESTKVMQLAVDEAVVLAEQEGAALHEGNML